MKYRTKIFGLFLLLIVVTTCFGMSLLYLKSKHLLFSNLKAKTLIVAQNTAKSIEGLDVSAINPTIRKVRNENQREDLLVLSIYVVRLSSGHFDMVANTSSDFSSLASPPVELVDHLNEPWAYVEANSNVLGFAPILGEDGKYAATVGVHLSAQDVLRTLTRLRIYVAITFVAMSIVGLLFAAWLSRFVTSSLNMIREGVMEIGKGNLQLRLDTQTNDEFAILAGSINGMAKGLREHERLKSSFIRYVSQHILEEILHSNVPITLKGEERKVTILFADLIGFRKIADHLPPEEVVSILNEFLDKMLTIIFANRGTLDKFMGEGVMGAFGAPFDDPYQEKNGIQTAVEMQKALLQLNEKWVAQGRPALEMAIGINTGFAIVGNIGSEKRMDYTAIGDAVNIASRLMAKAKELKVSILISESTMDSLYQIFRAKTLGLVEISGRENPIHVYAIEGENK